MTDVFSKNKRSLVMASIRSTGNADTELLLAKIFRKYRIHGWKRHMRLPGKPDFTFHKERLVVFVDGCFWHGCPEHGRQPRSNASYWRQKLLRNKKRDASVSRELKARGWNVIRLWEHDLKSPLKVVRRVRSRLI